MGRTRETETVGGRVKMVDNDGEVNDGKLEEEVAASSEARVEAAASSEAAVEAAVCSGAGIEDGRWRWHKWQAAAMARWCLGRQKSEST
jgi:hypothetical protein